MDTTRTLSVRGSTSVDGRTTSSCYSGSGKRTSMEKPHSTTPLPAWCPPCEPLAQTTDSCFSSQDGFALSSGSSVLDVLARASFRVLRRCLSVSVGVQNANGVDQGQCFVPWRGLAGFHVTVGPSRGHIPFQAVILDLEVAAYVKRGNAIFQAYQAIARFSQSCFWRQQRL